MLSRHRKPLAVYGLVCAIMLLSIAFSVSKLPGDTHKSGARFLSVQNPAIPVYQAAKDTNEIDYVELLRSIRTKNGFVETFNWWHEPWRLDVGLAAYWRPLTMQLLWLQYRAFGEEYPYNWVRVSIVAQLVYSLLFAAFVYRLTGRYSLALLTILVIAFPRDWLNAIPFFPTTVHSPSMLLLEKGWKDQPDLFANIFTVSALLLSLKQRWYLALSCAAVAVCFKESGWLAFVLAPVAVWLASSLNRAAERESHLAQSGSSLGEGVGRGRSFAWFYVATAIVISLLLALRYSAGPAVFFAHTREAKTGWFTEYLHSISSIGVVNLSFYPEAILALAICFVFTRWSPKSVTYKTAIVGIALVIAVFLGALQQQVTFPEAASLLIQGQFREGLQLLLWLALFVPLVLDDELRRVASAFVIFGLIAAAPHAATPQANLHTLSLAIFFQSAFVACMIAAATKAWAAKFQQRRFSAVLAKLHPSLFTTADSGGSPAEWA